MVGAVEDGLQVNAVAEQVWKLHEHARVLIARVAPFDYSVRCRDGDFPRVQKWFQDRSGFPKPRAAATPAREAFSCGKRALTFSQPLDCSVFPHVHINGSPQIHTAHTHSARVAKLPRNVQNRHCHVLECNP